MCILSWLFLWVLMKGSKDWQNTCETDESGSNEHVPFGCYLENIQVIVAKLIENLSDQTSSSLNWI